MGIDLTDAIEAEASNNDSSNGNDKPSFGDDMSPNEFCSACEEYAEWAVENYDEFDEVSLDTVTVEVSQKLKRAAGKAGESRTSPTKWMMRFAYGAYESWGWDEEIEKTIRHELIHIKQHQETGSGGHGSDFKLMADNVDAPRHCPQFTEYTFGIFCSGCDEQVAGRHRESKMVKQAERYRSKCCSASCYSERL